VLIWDQGSPALMAVALSLFDSITTELVADWIGLDWIGLLSSCVHAGGERAHIGGEGQTRASRWSCHTRRNGNVRRIGGVRGESVSQPC